MKRKYLLLPLVALILVLPGCRTITQPTSFAPSDLTGQIVSSSEISLTWKDNSADEKGFYIYRKTTDNYSRIGVVLADTNSYNDKGLDPETTYTYKVTAYNDGGESESSNEITITTTTKEQLKPKAPSNLTATAITYDQIELNWQDNSNNEDGFVVACNAPYEGIEYYEVADLDLDTTYFLHLGLDPLKTYRYYVYAYNEKGETYSNQTEAKTPSGIEILDYELTEYFEGEISYAWVIGHAQSNINNVIYATIRVWFYDSDNLYLDSAYCHESNLPPLAKWKFHTQDGPKIERGRVDHVTVEITSVYVYD